MNPGQTIAVKVYLQSIERTVTGMRYYVKPSSESFQGMYVSIDQCITAKDEKVEPLEKQEV